MPCHWPRQAHSRGLSAYATLKRNHAQHHLLVHRRRSEPDGHLPRLQVQPVGRARPRSRGGETRSWQALRMGATLRQYQHGRLFHASTARGFPAHCTGRMPARLTTVDDAPSLRLHRIDDDCERPAHPGLVGVLDAVHRPVSTAKSRAAPAADARIRFCCYEPAAPCPVRSKPPSTPMPCATT